MKTLLIVTILALILTACGGDDEPQNLITQDLEPTQFSFSEKPTDQQVLSFLQKKGRFDIELSDNAGKNSTYQLRKRWQKGFAYKINAKVEGNPDGILRVGGFVQFQINGSNYDFDAVKPLTTQILGLDIPDEEVLVEIINNDMKTFIPTHYNIVFNAPKITLADEEHREIFWYSPKSFKVNFDVTYSSKGGSNRVETKQCLRGLRFYRDEIKSPFNRIVGEMTKCKILETKKYSFAEFDKIPTLEAIQKEKQAQAELAKLVEIDIPDFKDVKQAMRFVYKTLYNADKETAKSLLMKMLKDSAFIKGSKSQLSGEGFSIMQLMNYSLFKTDVTFSQSYCPQMFMKKFSRETGEFWDALQKARFRISIEKSGGKMVKGKMVGAQFKISTLNVYTISRESDIEILNSWDLDELCAEASKKFEVF